MRPITSGAYLYLSIAKNSLHDFIAKYYSWKFISTALQIAEFYILQNKTSNTKQLEQMLLMRSSFCDPIVSETVRSHISSLLHIPKIQDALVDVHEPGITDDNASECEFIHALTQRKMPLCACEI